VKGDRRSLSIAAASVVAKVARDRLMHELATRCPGYGWETNVGYGTDEHYLGLLRLGPTAHHRQSFAPLNTLFADAGRRVSRYRFCAVDTFPEPGRVEILKLRRDLHAVFDGEGRHIGQVKNLRGRWTFQSVGYGAEGGPVPGGGPCAHRHGAALAGPDRAGVVALLAPGGE
jgi:hypothetical protein